MILFIDLETFSPTPLKYGVYKYAELSEILIIAYAVDDGPVQVIDVTNRDHYWTEHQNFIEAFAAADTIVAHNTGFDRVVLERHGFKAPIEKWHCTMARAMAHSLPGGLANLCTIMKVPVTDAKVAGGKNLINLFCKPLQKHSELRRATRETNPLDWSEFLRYAGCDVSACRVLYRKLPRHNYCDAELALWHLDQRINDRGIQTDLALCTSAISAAHAEQKRLRERTQTATAGLLDSTTKRDEFLKLLLGWYGVELPDMQAGTIERRLDDPELPDDVKELLRIRLMASKTTATKYAAVMNSVCDDGRLRGLLAFCGALRTGRWAGRLFQPQNLMRTPKHLAKQMDFVIECIKTGSVDLFFEDVMEALGAAARGALCAAPGHTLICADLKQIESRFLAWLAGEWWKVKAFEAFDAGTGPDIYVQMYAQTFGVAPAVVLEDHEAGGKMRLIGKVADLACGFQGADGAFATMGLAYGIELPQEQIMPIVGAYRRANPAIVALWAGVQAGAVKAISAPGVTVTYGRLQMVREGPWFRIRLPSGRQLCYPYPVYGMMKVKCRNCGGAGHILIQVAEDEIEQHECGRCGGSGRRNEEVISYSGINQYTRKWERLHTFGGKLVENIVQGGSRDVLAHNMQAADDAGYALCLSVHDELITEVPVDQGYTPEGLSEIMTRVPPWAQGLPLAADGYAAERYRKA